MRPHPPSVSLAALSLTAFGLPAADINPVQYGGFIETVLAVQDGDSALPTNAAVITATAAAQLRASYAITERTSGLIELRADDTGIEFKQAVAEWQVGDDVRLQVGRFTSWIGWESTDSPERYRVNRSLMLGAGPLAPLLGPQAQLLNVAPESVTGAAIHLAESRRVSLALHLVDFIWDQPDERPSDSLSAAAVIGFHGASWDASLRGSYGQEEWLDRQDLFQFEATAELRGLRETQGLLFATDLLYTGYDLSESLGILALANWQLPDSSTSLTASINWVDPVMDDDLRSNDEALEVAFAVLTNPTADANFAINAEARYIARATADSDEFGLFLEALAVIP
ncbi:MAG: outer membrane beta-barrel protein [Planctomycetota bacterium]|jgi:hypothetical protein|nr:outer membrane beta-barrel protein [Planctomycetota bacterium]